MAGSVVAIMDESEIGEYIYGSLRCPPGLSRLPDATVRRPQYAGDLLRSLGLLPLAVPAIAVTGSKGKGSTVRYIASILDAMGYLTGWVNSPSLSSLRERIRLGTEPIAPAELERYFLALQPALEAARLAVPSDTYLGPHAAFLSIALSWWRDQGVEAIVAEAGRGARFDEISVLGAGVGVITTILPEHPRQLGPGLDEIAWHKAGIVPVNGVALLGQVGVAQARVVAAEAEARGARLLALGHDIGVVRGSDGFRVDTPRAGYEGLSSGLAGDYQAANAALAIGAVEALLERRLPIEAVRLGLRRVRNPGRLTQAEAGGTPCLVDATVERASATAVADWLRRAPRPRRLVLAIPSDKDLAGVLDALAGSAEEVFLSHCGNPHLSFEQSAEDALSARYGLSSCRFADGREAVSALRGSDGSLALLGTLSFVGEALDALGVPVEEAWT